MRLYLVSILNIGLSPESLSKESIWQNEIRRFQSDGAPCLFSGSFVTPIQLGGALVIAEIRRRENIKL